ncbi:DUF3857 domain-containing protein [bacterium]|nr:DUF3857 domain-containing protein [bacterium]
MNRRDAVKMIRFIMLFALLLSGLFTGSIEARAQAPDWAAPCDAMVVKDIRTYEIHRQGKASFHVYRVVDIYSEAGTEEAAISVYESNYVKIKKLRATVLDLHGNVIKQYKASDFKKTTIVDFSVLYDDVKYYYLDLSRKIYPYRIAYHYEQEFKSLFFWPGWFPQEDIPVQLACYQLKMHKSIDYKLQVIGFSGDAKKSIEGKVEVVSWTMDSLDAFIPPMYCPPEFKNPISLNFSASQFSLDGSHAQARTWADLAQWYAALAMGRYDLPEQVIFEVEELISGLEDPIDKIRVLYRYLQKKTRYVAIEWGLQGWQPHSAEQVYNNSYGDCKGLTTLMVGLLNAAKVKAYPALIRSRRSGVVDPAFPRDQFNHVITVVPLAQDTIWLETTADRLAAGELPSSDEGCNVLIVHDNTGTLVRTPVSAPNKNRWIGNVNSSLLPSGDLSVSGSISLTGNQAAWYRNKLQPLDTEERQEFISVLIKRYHSKMNLLEFELINLEKEVHLPLKISFSGLYKKFYRAGKKRLFIKPSFFNRKIAGNVPRDKVRCIPIYHGYCYLDEDSVCIEIPEGYELEAAPDSVRLCTSFGEFNMSFTFKDGQLRFYRKYSIDKRLMPVEEYSGFVAFLTSIVKMDKSSFVFRRMQ